MGLAGHPLREVLAFKGGTALRRCWFENYRFSEDLDFTLTRTITFEKILTGLNEIFTAIEAACGLQIAFDREDRHGHMNSHTLYLRYQGPLPGANDVKVDITIDEILCYPLKERSVPRTYEEFDDLPESPTVKVYAIEEIVVEKLLALSDRSRNEPRDLYDLWYLFGSADLHIAEMRTELDAKLAFHRRIVVGMEQAIAGKEERPRRLWANRLAHQMNNLPPFDDVFRKVLRVVRAADFPETRSCPMLGT
nr:nucleotidyl transferase AbiEii/AbiGii toxin family protein [Pararobbsia alpina]